MAADGRLHVRESAGGGPAVAWIHGYTMDSGVWERLWRLLPGWTHLGIDLPGHGQSRPLAAAESLPELGREIAAVCARHDARHLVGLSFGSTIALQAAVAAGPALASLTLAAPAVAGGPTDPAAEVRYGQLAEMYRTYGPGPHLTALWMSSPPDIFRHAARHPPLWAALSETVARHGWHELGDGAMRSLAGHRQSPAELAGLAAATLVLIGEHEMPAFRHSAAILAAAVPRCQVVEVADAGHLSPLERPELVAPALDAHLRAAESLTPPTS